MLATEPQHQLNGLSTRFRIDLHKHFSKLQLLTIFPSFHDRGSMNNFEVYRKLHRPLLLPLWLYLYEEPSTSQMARAALSSNNIITYRVLHISKSHNHIHKSLP